MKFGFVLPTGDSRTAANAAYEAEQAGWDGFFVWEPIWGVDAWVSLAAAAMLTRQIRLGTMLTPLPIRKPWKLASETASVDRLSEGRLTLSVGLGATETGFANFGEVTYRKTRAELLDEGLDILTGLWRGQPFNYEGKHYHLQQTTFELPPPPVQQPIPIWVVGAWPRMKSMRRVLKYQGILPNKFNPDGTIGELTPEDVHAIKSFVTENRDPQTPFEIIAEGHTPGDDPGKAAEKVLPWQDAGATWWIEALWENRDPDHIWQRLKQGPPRTR